MPHAMADENYTGSSLTDAHINSGDNDPDFNSSANVDSLRRSSSARNAFFPIVAHHNEQSNARCTSADDTAQNLQLRAARIRIKNRRRMYLERNPEYFSARDLELAGAFTPSHLISIHSIPHR